MIRIAHDIPNFVIIMSIHDIGNNLAAKIIAKTGDISKFINYKQLGAYTGLDPRINESGQKDGKNLHITKKRNKRLIWLLCLAVIYSLKLKKVIIRASFFIKKTQQSDLLCPKAAQIVCANKLVQIIHNMC